MIDPNVRTSPTVERSVPRLATDTSSGQVPAGSVGGVKTRLEVAAFVEVSDSTVAATPPTVTVKSLALAVWKVPVRVTVEVFVMELKVDGEGACGF